MAGKELVNVEADKKEFKMTDKEAMANYVIKCVEEDKCIYDYTKIWVENEREVLVDKLMPMIKDAVIDSSFEAEVPGVIINQANKAKIEEMIAKAQKGKRVRLASYDLIVSYTLAIEEKLNFLSKNSLEGAEFDVTPFTQKQYYSRNSSYSVPTTTGFTLRYRNRKWRLLWVDRESAVKAHNVRVRPELSKKLSKPYREFDVVDDEF